MGWNSAPIRKPEISARGKKSTSNLCKHTLDVYPTPWKQRFNLTSFFLTIFPDVSCSLTDVPFTRKLCSWEWECYGHGCYRQWLCQGKVWNKTLHLISSWISSFVPQAGCAGAVGWQAQPGRFNSLLQHCQVLAGWWDSQIVIWGRKLRDPRESLSDRAAVLGWCLGVTKVYSQRKRRGIKGLC